MAQPSKLVTDRAKSSRSVIAAGSEHLDAVVSAAEKKYGTPFGDVVRVVLETMVTNLSSVTAEMESADLAHAAELGDDDGARKQRDDASEGGRQALIQARGALTTVYGNAFVNSLGYGGDTPDDPQQVLHLLRTVGPALQSRPLPAASVPGVKVDVPVLRERITAATPPLEAALDEVAKELRQNEATQVAKNEAIRRNDVAFSETAGIISTLLRLAGLEALADRVRPSVGRPGRTVVDVGEVTVEVPPHTHAHAGPVSEPA